MFLILRSHSSPSSLLSRSHLTPALQDTGRNTAKGLGLTADFRGLGLVPATARTEGNALVCPADARLSSRTSAVIKIAQALLLRSHLIGQTLPGSYIGRLERESMLHAIPAFNRNSGSSGSCRNISPNCSVFQQN